MRSILFIAFLGTHSAALAKDFVGCRATCIAIDSNRNQIAVLGSAKGSSEISTEEAFDLMERDCRIKAEDTGVAGYTLLVNEIEAAQFARSDAQSFSTKHWRSGQVESESSMSYHGKPVGYESCGLIEKERPGHRKYTGSLRPLG